MRELGFDHQHCTFHLLLNINEELREELNQMRKEYESNLKKQNPKLSETQIKKQSKNMINNYKIEINEYLSIFYKLFRKETYEEAIKYINFLKEELINFPPILAKYLKKKFFPEYGRKQTTNQRKRVERIAYKVTTPSSQSCPSAFITCASTVDSRSPASSSNTLPQASQIQYSVLPSRSHKASSASTFVSL